MSTNFRNPSQIHASLGPHSYDECSLLITKLKNNEPFSIARYNDGEFISISGWDFIYNTPANKSPGNIDGHKYPDKLNDCLRTAISCDENVELSKQKKYIFQSKLELYRSKHNNHPSFQKINFKVDTIKNDFSNFVYEFPNLWIDFVNQINNYKIVFIGPEYCKNISFLKIKRFITIPLTNCFSQVENIQNQIENEITKTNETIIFLFAAGLTTNYIIEKLKSKTINQHFMIDIGSAFDNFLSKESFPEIRRRLYNPPFIKKHYPSWFITKRDY